MSEYHMRRSVHTESWNYHDKLYNQLEKDYVSKCLLQVAEASGIGIQGDVVCRLGKVSPDSSYLTIST